MQNVVGSPGTSQTNIYNVAPRPVLWPITVGAVPGLAAAFQQRPRLRERVRQARERGGGVVLTQVLSGGGGTGKSQLAASYAHQAARDGVDLVVWVAATDPDSIIAGYADAAAAVGAVASLDGGDPVADAAAFVRWLHRTDRRWLVVLDDVTDPAPLGAWWPASSTSTGWVLATTRQRGAGVTGGGRAQVDVGLYEPEEARDYLRDRLTGSGAAEPLDAPDELASELGYLPLALSHAAAYLIDQGIGCAEYLVRYKVERGRLDELMPATADTDNYGRAVATTWSLSMAAADAAAPVGLATPAMRLAALLDPAGHPEELWSTPAVTTYLTATKSVHSAAEPAAADSAPPPPVTPREAREAVRTLHRFSLLSHDTEPGTRSKPLAGLATRLVRMHVLTQRAVLETLDAATLRGAARVAADALLAVWPSGGIHADTAASATLRANTDVLASRAGPETLWQPDPHPLLYRAGRSMVDRGLSAAALQHWQSIADVAERLLGPEHPHTLAALGNLADAYRETGRPSNALKLLERVAAESERLLGPEHPDTLLALGNLAITYHAAGRTSDAIELQERVAADRGRLLGPEHPDTLTALGNLAGSYAAAGRTGDAIRLEERVAADRDRLLGPEHPATLTALGNLASFYSEAGRTADAMELLERVAAESERLLGPEHPDTLLALGNVAITYHAAGRTSEAIELQERVAADRGRLLGPEHPHTLTALGNLAGFYAAAGRTGDAIELQGRVAAEVERLLGPEHPATLTELNNLANSYSAAGRIGDAIELQGRVAADVERLLGAEHPYTLTALNNLAGSYAATGRIGDAIRLQERVAAESERLLGPEHPATLTAMRNLAGYYYTTGRNAAAVELLSRAAAISEQLLGPEHPSTEEVMQALRSWRQG